jgi:hypothetical protein
VSADVLNSAVLTHPLSSHSLSLHIFPLIKNRNIFYFREVLTCLNEKGKKICGKGEENKQTRN